MTSRLRPGRVARAAGRRVPRRPFRLVMPLWIWRPLFRFWLSVVRARPRPRPRREGAARDLRRRLPGARSRRDRLRQGRPPEAPADALPRLLRRACEARRDRPRHRHGQGRARPRPRRSWGRSVVGVDHDPSHLAFARAHFADERLEFRGGDVIDGIPAGHFDVVVLSNVLEHLDPRVEFLARVVESATPRCVLLRVPLYERDWTVPLKAEVGLPSVLGSGPRDRVRRAALPGRAREPPGSTYRARPDGGARSGPSRSRDERCWSLGQVATRRAGARWSRLLDRAAGRIRAFASSTATTACPRPVSPSPAARRSSSGWQLASPTTRRTSRSSTSARPGCRATFARCSGSCGGARSRSSLNQNGVGYPGWAGSDAETFNRPLRRVLGAAEHVLYQSEFCKRSADEFVGRARRLVGDPAQRGRDSALHSGGAASGGRPRAPPRRRPDQAYRLELGLETLAALLPSQPDAQLLVTGRLVRHPEPLASASGSGEHVHSLGRYAQSRRSRDLPPRPCPPAHEGERPVPERRPRGDGVRPAGRLSAKRRRSRARRRRCRHRRAPSRRLRARRAAERRGARRRGHARARRSARVRARPRARVRSTGSRSSPGSTVTASCSRASRRGSPRPGRARSPVVAGARARRARTSDDQDAAQRAHEHPCDRRGPGSRACGGGSRGSLRHAAPTARVVLADVVPDHE